MPAETIDIRAPELPKSGVAIDMLRNCGCLDCLDFLHEIEGKKEDEKYERKD